MTKNIAIIGGSGYVGVQLTRYLTTKGYSVSIIDLKAPPKISDFRYIRADLLELKAADIDSYSHLVLLAAHSSVRQAADDPLGAIRTNIAGVQGLLSVMQENQILYFASSGSVYDGVKNNSAREETILSTPRNLYDLSKRVAEDIIAMSGKHSIIFRFGTVNGPSESMRNDLVINALVESAITKKRIHISNGQVNRAILSIDDLCAGIENAISFSEKSDQLEIYNLASFNMTVNEIGEGISKYFQVPIIQEPPSSTYDFSMNSSKAEKYLGFHPVDTLDTLVQKLENFIKY